MESKFLYLGELNCDYSKKAYAYLKKFSKSVKAVWTTSSDRNKKIPKTLNKWSGEYILSFRCYFILPKSLLNNAKIACINIHPSTPKYPGSGSINWALYYNDKFFGVTTHIMNEKVDSGKILFTKNFRIKKKDNFNTIKIKTMKYCLLSFKNLTNQINKKEFNIKNLAKKNNLKWNGKTRKISDITDKIIITKKISKKELKRRIKSFHNKNFPLEYLLHNYSFKLN